MRASRKNLSTRWVGLVTGEIGMSTFMESPWCGLEEWRSWHVLCHACSLCAWIKTLLVSLSCATVWGRILAGECVGTSLTPVECHLWGKQKKMGGTHKALSSRKFWAYWLYVLRLLKSKIGRGKFRVFGDTFMSVQLLNTLVQYLQSYHQNWAPPVSSIIILFLLFLSSRRLQTCFVGSTDITSTVLNTAGCHVDDEK